jgi:hypothetical protein
MKRRDEQRGVVALPFVLSWKDMCGLDLPKLSIGLAAQLHPKVDESAAANLNAAGALSEGLDRRVGLDHQPSAIGVIAPKAQPSTELRTEHFDAAPPSAARDWQSSREAPGIRMIGGRAGHRSKNGTFRSLQVGSTLLRSLAMKQLY